MGKQKVCIIGAGPAGLTAAYELLRRSPDYEVTLLEASGEIGGISRTVRYKGNRMDIGGHRFFSKDERVMQWWMEMMPVQGKPSFDDLLLHREKALSPGGPDPEQEDRVLLLRNRISRIFYLRKFFDYPITMKMQTLRNMGLGRAIKAGCSYLKAVLFKREEKNLEDFYINRFGKVLYSMFFEGYTEKLWGRHPSQIMADWGAQRVKGLSVSAILKDMFRKLLHLSSDKVETSLIEAFYYPKFGPGQMWELVALEIERMGGSILRDCRVDSLRCEGDEVRSLRCTQNGEVKNLDADIVLSSMPLRDLVVGMQTEHMPREVLEIARGLPYRDFITVGLLVDKMKIHNETHIPTLGNIVPDCWIYVQETDVKLGRMQIFNNWSPYLVERPEETVWIGLEYFCEEGDDLWAMSDEAFVELAVSELISLGVIEGGNVLDSHRERVQKAYPAYFDTYTRIDQVIAFVDGFRNLYCIGRNGQHRYNNMDHSMATSFEAVENILTGRQDKSNVWNVNTEKDYHEEKQSEG